MAKKHKPHKIYWHKEIILVLLAILSVCLLVFDLVRHPKGNIEAFIVVADFVIACIFLADFWFLYRRSRQKEYFMKHNWYLLLSAMPIMTSWFTPLRALRFVRFTRLIIAGEHIEQSVLQNKKKL